jgi:hypothetical protein
VIEEEELLLHFGWAWFGLLLVFRAWIVCRLSREKSQKIGNNRKKSEKG